MGYPQLSNRFTDYSKKEKSVDKSKLWYDGWEEDARQRIFEENHYPNMIDITPNPQEP